MKKITVSSSVADQIVALPQGSLVIVRDHSGAPFDAFLRTGSNGWATTTRSGGGRYMDAEGMKDIVRAYEKRGPESFGPMTFYLAFEGGHSGEGWIR